MTAIKSKSVQGILLQATSDLIAVRSVSRVIDECTVDAIPTTDLKLH